MTKSTIILTLLIFLSASLNSKEDNNHGIDLGYIEDGIKKIEVYKDGHLNNVTEYFLKESKVIKRYLGKKDLFYINCPKYNDSLVAYWTREFFLDKKNLRVDSVSSYFHNNESFLISSDGSSKPKDSIPDSLILINKFLGQSDLLFSFHSFIIEKGIREEYMSTFYCNSYSQLKFKTIIDHKNNKIELFQYEYDSNGKKIKELKSDKYSKNDTTEFIYNKQGFLKRKNSLLYSYSYKYDTLGNLKSLISTNTYSSLGIDTTYYEYEDSLLISKTYISEGIQTNYTYKYYYYD